MKPELKSPKLSSNISLQKMTSLSERDSKTSCRHFSASTTEEKLKSIYTPVDTLMSEDAKNNTVDAQVDTLIMAKGHSVEGNSVEGHSVGGHSVGGHSVESVAPVQITDTVGVMGQKGLSAEGDALLKDVEGLRLQPYDDQTGQTITSWVEGATVGYGHLISKSEWSVYENGITSTQANTLFAEDLAPFVSTVNDSVTADLSQHQFDAAVILAYNIGESGFSNSSAVKLMNDPEAATAYPDLEGAWKAWNKSQGDVNDGLINRRNAEWNLYTNGIYQRW